MNFNPKTVETAHLHVARVNSLAIAWNEKTNRVDVAVLAFDGHNDGVHADAAGRGTARAEVNSRTRKPNKRELTPTEKRVLARLVLAESNPEIALALGLSGHTVKFHLDSITKKLDAKNRVHIAVMAVQQALV